MKLPALFTEKMESLLKPEEFQEFLKSYQQSRFYGLRVNTLKVSIEDFLSSAPFELTPIPWTKDGFYYREGESPGKHPYYYAGLYYIQEPSAMLPGEVLGALPGERVLDLCAAPGGKTVQIAASMKGQGILVANDISAERVKALVKNIELCGVKNVIVTNETPEKLAGKFEGYFDRILVDAPCSGEGMFRKDEDAVKSWEKFKCEKCAGMQWEILAQVDRMLKPGGTMVYSTCTFSPEENEQMIARFVMHYGHYEIVEIPKGFGIEHGRPEWVGNFQEIENTARLWPHRIQGEGHFVAKLRKKDDLLKHHNQNPQQMLIKEDIPPELDSFLKEQLQLELHGFYCVKGNNVYLLPEGFPDLGGIKVAKFGWYLGGLERGKFQPSHSMIIALQKDELRHVLNFSSHSKEVQSYLKGETLMLEDVRGMTGVLVDGFTLGWAKGNGDLVKNLYPKGWRKLS